MTFAWRLRRCGRSVIALSAIWCFAIFFSAFYHEDEVVPTASVTSTKKGLDFFDDPRPADKYVGEQLVSAGEVTPQIPPVDQETPLPGEMGKAIVMDELKLHPVERKKYLDGFKAHAFNKYASDLMSLQRSLPDVRDVECKRPKYYLDGLPDTSVIICFHNEALSTLLRTVHSVINRSPGQLLKEIILVDDFSTEHDLKATLDEYLKANQLSAKVRVIRTNQREGLIRARLTGVKFASGDVLTFLDSHCEATVGWLEPLLYRISQNRSHVVTPVIDVIDDVTLAYTYDSTKTMSVGGFDWNLFYTWLPINEREQEKRQTFIDPVRTPTMAGGLFAIDRDYFHHIGTYDSGMDIWGGENLELSFRIWMCGGSLEIIPCSRVGHIFRKRNPYTVKEESEKLRRNLIRLAEVWMDGYKWYYYERLFFHVTDPGDISERLKLKRDLKCHSFQWYLDNIYPEMFIPSEAKAYGLISNAGNSNLCLAGQVDEPEVNHHPVVAHPCINRTLSQTWYLTKLGEIRRDDGCIDYSGGATFRIYRCHGLRGNQHFEYLPQSGLLWHTGMNVCIELADDDSILLAQKCSAKNNRQRWLWHRRQADEVPLHLRLDLVTLKRPMKTQSDLSI